MPEFTIQGVVWGGIRPQAIINDRVFEKGDIIEGAEIVDIDKQGVTFVIEIEVEEGTYAKKKFRRRPVLRLRKIGE